MGKMKDLDQRLEEVRLAIKETEKNIEDFHMDLVVEEDTLEGLKAEFRELMLEKKKIEEANKKKVIATIPITRDQVEMSNSCNKPNFNTIWHFREWMKIHSINKPYMEWNGQLHRTDVVMDNRFMPIAKID